MATDMEVDELRVPAIAEEEVRGGPEDGVGSVAGGGAPREGAQGQHVGGRWLACDDP